jgi:hypothetical protein
MLQRVGWLVNDLSKDRNAFILTVKTAGPWVKHTKKTS